MSNTDNIFISYFDNGSVHVVAEVTKGNMYHGLFVRWNKSNIITEQSVYSHGKKHGLCIFRLITRGPDVTICYYNGKNINDQIKEIVKDINNITTEEKTQIALQFGLVL